MCTKKYYLGTVENNREIQLGTLHIRANSTVFFCVRIIIHNYTIFLLKPKLFHQYLLKLYLLTILNVMRVD